MSIDELQEELNNLVTADDLASIFGVHITTIWRWKNNDEEFRANEVRIPGNERDAIRYKLKGVLRWAARAEAERKTPGLKAWRATQLEK
jgi:hypothetical protein